MTHTDYTKNILNIKDENIYFNKNCLEIVKIKDVETKVFHGILTYNSPDFCPCCGVLMKIILLLNGHLKRIVELN